MPTEAEKILAENYGDAPAFTTADIIDRIPRPSNPMDIGAYLRDRAMRGEKFSPELTEKMAPEPHREPNWFGKALAAIPPEVSFVANFLGPGPKMLPRVSNPIRAYHGSPYDFDTFDMAHIGRGEGAQAYGHGLYFAGNPKVSDIYKKKLSANNNSGFMEYTVKTPYGGELNFSPYHKGELPDGVAPELHHAVNMLYWDSPAKAKAFTKQWLADAKDGKGLYPDRGVDYYQRLYDYVRQIKKSDIDLKRGRMYEVGLHTSPDELLNLDAPVTNQPREFTEMVREGLKREGYLRPKDDGPRQFSSAMDAWKMQHGTMTDSPMSALIDGRGNLLGKTPEEIAGALGERGIPGSRYWDGNSRSRSRGTQNYVVWNPEIIEIMKKYGIAAPVAAGSVSSILSQYGDGNQ